MPVGQRARRRRRARRGSDPDPREQGRGDNRYDVLGAITVVLGLGSLVYGFTLAEHSWVAPETIACLAVGVVLIALFVWIESRVAQPLLPLRVVTDKVRAGAFLVQAIFGALMIGALLYLALHLQIVLGLSPLHAGLGTLPMTIMTLLLAPVITKLLPRFGPRPLMIGGPLVAAAALLYLSRITVGGSYATEILPALVVLGVGMAMVLVPLQNVALSGSSPTTQAPRARPSTPRCRSVARSASRSSRPSTRASSRERS
ncbi:MFS transporter [Oerskovia sp. M15]